MTFHLLICLTAAHAQMRGSEGMAGTDIAAAIRNKMARILLSHSFGKHWTAEGQISFPVFPDQKKDKERTDHESEFNAYDSEEDERAVPSAAFTFCFWHDEAYRGPFISAGCRYLRDHVPECIIGAGYSARIGNHLAVRLSFDTGVGSNDTGQDDGITIGICYLF